MEDVTLNPLKDRFPDETAVLARVFDHTTTSYKLYWFKAILTILGRGEQNDIPIADILREMTILAWHTVTFFRLNLGHQDMLQHVVEEIHRRTHLDQQSDLEVVREAVLANPDLVADTAQIVVYVPARFLAPWFSGELRGLRDAKKNVKITALALTHAETDLPALYHFVRCENRPAIRVAARWRSFLLKNYAVVKDFVDLHLVDYLQRRNPSTPGIVHKLCLPPTRDLAYARKYWDDVRRRLVEGANHDVFRDVYCGEVLEATFAIDHFIPWSFVMHDLIWNLCPVSSSTNSSKGDRVPSLENYLTPLATLHHQTLHFAKANRRVSEMYIDCFRQEVETLVNMPFQEFRNRMQDALLPLAKVAGNQGFETGWVVKTHNIPEIRV
ncbi:MAG: hypothetical protein NTY19_28255 [Planctomycetota bacterium]|nr:hypothetical protein [Planctomycetota bacterium]